MKKVKFEKLWLLSQKEKKGRAETLSETVTAVIGDNGVGKSSLVKSLYSSFGADPRKIPEQWSNARVTTLLRFKLDEVPYYILRFGPLFALFDGDGKVIWCTQGIVKGLTPLLSPMLDFNIELMNRQNEPTPIPAFCFMPFYIDQDKGWSDTWESFDGTGVVPNYKSDVASFHTGIRPKEYYAAKAAKSIASADLSVLRQDRVALNRAEARFKEKRTGIAVAFEPEKFFDRIEALLIEQNAIQSLCDAAKSRVSELQSQRSMMLEEIDIAKRVLSELEDDLKFVAGVDETEIRCPTCNTVHRNDFANRYGLINDADACRMVVQNGLERATAIGREIEKAGRHIPGLEERVAVISAILEETRGEVKLGDMLRDESARIVDSTFILEGADIDAKIGAIDKNVSLAEAKMREYSSPTRKKAIEDFYVRKVLEFCRELGVNPIPEALTRSVRPSISEAGSVQPRLFLAYYYAVLHTIAKHSTALFAPIVVDTPKQQDQDDVNAKAMIRFCIERRPEGSQLILATGQLHGIEIPGALIAPTKKGALLDEEQFEAVEAFVTPFINRALAQPATTA